MRKREKNRKRWIIWLLPNDSIAVELCEYYSFILVCKLWCYGSAYPKRRTEYALLSQPLSLIRFIHLFPVRFTNNKFAFDMSIN